MLQNHTFGEANNPNKDHVIWLSRLPVIRAENHRLPIFAKTVLEIEVLWERTTVTLLATHLKAGQDQEREDYRVAEMQAILSLLRGCKNPFHALVGDLNTIHPSDHPNVSAYLAALRQRGEKAPTPQFPRKVIPLLLASGYVDCYHACCPWTSGYTAPTAYHALRIDYIFASSHLAQHLYACDTMTEGDAEKASDHFPLWAEFR
jgi:exodeoxyribonuclease-3